MNSNEARLKIHGTITDVLVAMAVDDDSTDEDVEQLADELGEVSNIIMEDLGLEVLSVEEDGSIMVKLQLFVDEDK